MFSANENLVLREHKRRVVAYVESTIPEHALEMGTMVMAMQVSCRSPGCVPLETAVAVVFPRGHATELIPGLEESGARGGTYKTKILMPMKDVTMEEVLDALPPEFEGGRRTMESLCLRARDVMLGQIGQITNDDDVDGRRMIADYLAECLKDYVNLGCVAPEVGKPFPEPVGDGAAAGADGGAANGAANGAAKGAENMTEASTRNVDADADADGGKAESDSAPSEPVSRGISASGNFVIRRRMDEDYASEERRGMPPRSAPIAAAGAAGATVPSAKRATTEGETATDWRRRQRMEAEVKFALSGSAGTLQKLAEREHAPGIRKPGCPCCDPDDPANIVDAMMML